MLNESRPCRILMREDQSQSPHPAMSDYTIMVKDQAQVFLGGPPLVEMATGEKIDAESLGGASLHASITGLADQLATDE